jgi:hypothetical protein
LAKNTAAIEDLPRFIVRACFSRKSMRYLPVKKTVNCKVKVICTAKDGRSLQYFNALDWLAQLVTHISKQR